MFTAVAAGSETIDDILFSIKLKTKENLSGSHNRFMFWEAQYRVIQTLVGQVSSRGKNSLLVPQVGGDPGKS